MKRWVFRSTLFSVYRKFYTYNIHLTTFCPMIYTLCCAFVLYCILDINSSILKDNFFAPSGFKWSASLKSDE